MSPQVDVQEAESIIQDMHQFHYRAWDKMDGLEQCARTLKDRKGGDKSAPFHEVEEIRLFFRDDVGPHFQMEEAKIYPFVRNLMAPRRRVAITYMIREHRSIWQQVIIMRELCQAVHDRGENMLAEQAGPLGEVALLIVRLMRRHISKENLIYQTIEAVM